MKLTPVLLYRHPKYYYYAHKFGWGLKKFKEKFHKRWKFEIGINSKLPVEDYVTERKFEIPPGYVIKNPVDFMEEIRDRHVFKSLPKERPWPFNPKAEPGSRLDPDYKEERAMVFDRKFKLLEGYKGALNFTNSILESDESLPDKIMNKDDKLTVDDEIMGMLERQLEWLDKLDSFNQRNNEKFTFPRLNKHTVPTHGPTLDRKELNALTTYADCSELLIAKHFGHCYYPRVISPKFEIGFKRDDFRCILDLRCDFITLQQNPVDEFLRLESSDQSNATHQLDHRFSVASTKEKELLDIHPLNWEINFEPRHFYPDDESLNKPSRVTAQNIDTVFLGNNFNIHKPTPDRIIKGKLLLHLYGYAVGRARHLFGNVNDFQDQRNYEVLDRPVTIKGVFGNFSKRNMGFACLQLNTLGFDSEIKNQVWFDGPYDVIEDREIILRKLALMNLNSYELMSPQSLG